MTPYLPLIGLIALVLIGLRLLACAAGIVSAFLKGLADSLQKSKRFYGYRRLWALVGAGLSTVISGIVVRTAVPIDNQFANHLIAISWWCLGCLWFCEITLFLRAWGISGIERHRDLCFFGTTLTVLFVSRELFQLTMLAPNTITMPGGIPWATIATGLSPLLLGTTIAIIPDLLEAISNNRVIRRHFISEGNCAGWLGPRGFKRFIRKWPKVDADAGVLSSGLFVGWTSFESFYSPREPVFLEESAHACSVAMTGAGKKLAIACGLSTWPGSTVVVSTKSELADELCGRRADAGLFEDPLMAREFENLGVDPRKISRVKYRIPNGRSFVLDPAGSSRYAPGSGYDFLSELDPQSPFVTELIMAVARGAIPDQEFQRDRFWTLGPRGLLASALAHVLVTEKDPSKRNLPAVADFLMGIDPKTGRSDPDVWQNNVITMLQNTAMNGFVQRGAANISNQMGTNAYGGIMAEIENNTRFMTVPWIRSHLSRPSEFSYTEVGIDAAPISIFLVPPRGDAAFQTALPWLRMHLELCLQLQQIKTVKPTNPTLIVCDEFRQYGKGIEAIRNGLTVLRDCNVKLWLFAQSWKSLEFILGVDGAAELESSTAMQYFGCNDLETATRISRRLGKTTRRQGDSIDLVSPAEVLRELALNSNLQYVFPTSSAPMRIERPAHLTIRTREGGTFVGLPLAGHFDEGPKS